MKIYSDCPTCNGVGEVYKGDSKGWQPCSAGCDEGVITTEIKDGK